MSQRPVTTRPRLKGPQPAAVTALERRDTSTWSAFAWGGGPRLAMCRARGYTEKSLAMEAARQLYINAQMGGYQ